MTTSPSNAVPTPTLRERILSMSNAELRAIVGAAKRRDGYSYEYRKALDELIARQIARVMRDFQEDGTTPGSPSTEQAPASLGPIGLATRPDWALPTLFDGWDWMSPGRRAIAAKTRTGRTRRL